MEESRYDKIAVVERASLARQRLEDFWGYVEPKFSRRLRKDQKRRLDV